MAFIDDLQKSVGLFTQGLQKLSTTRAFSRATEQIDQINATIADENERREQLQQTSQQLAQDLSQAGAPVSQIQSAFEAFRSPPLVSPAEQIQLGVEAEDPTAVRRGQDIQRAQTQVAAERAGLRQTAAAGREQRGAERALSKEGRSAFRKTLSEFRSENRESIEAVGVIDAALNSLDTEKDPIVVANGVRVLLKLSGEERFSEQDFKVTLPGGRSAVQNLLRRISEEGFNPKALPRDVAVLKRVIRSLGKSHLLKLDKDAKDKAESVKGLIPGFDTDRISESLKLRIPKSRFIKVGSRITRQPATTGPTTQLSIPGFTP